jgi:excinuclease ABC subunit C
MTPEAFQILQPTIPKQPGIYKYYGATNELLYVGKAKNIFKRVSSYFTKTNHSYKTIELVKQITRIEFGIVNTEHEALLLENSLIKEFQPKDNINLKDDKTYPYIVIKNEPYPRIFFTRRRFKDGSQYFGPYTSVQATKELIYFLKQNIALRTCKLNLTKKNINAGKFKVCLEYHLGNCKGPCANLQTEADYLQDVDLLKELIKGNIKNVLSNFKAQMQHYATNMQFEKAGAIKKKIDQLQAYQVKNSVVNINTDNVDVFGYLQEGTTTYVNYLKVVEGAIVNTKTVWVETQLDETLADIMAFAITDLRNEFFSAATEIVLQDELEITLPEVTIIVPKAGDKKKLLDLSLQNVNYFKNDIIKKKLLNLEQRSATDKLKVLDDIKNYLHLQKTPLHIECFDNSNFQGTNPVSAVVVFKNGEPSRAEYRRFKVKTVIGANDFATMTEAVYRRYRRQTEENQPLPQLVIIDGGKGQLGAAMESIKALNLLGQFTIVGLAKNEEEIFFPGDSESFKLPWDSEALKLIRRIRDEVHNHGITYHRMLRSKNAFNNELETIPGVGPATMQTLLQTYKSVKNIATKSYDDLVFAIGKAKAKTVVNYFEAKKKGQE